MVYVGLQTEKKLEAVKFFQDLNEKLSDEDIVKNPFKGSLSSFYSSDNSFFLLDITPVYPPVWYFMFIPILLGLFFAWFWLFWVGLGLLLVTGFFYSPLFFALMLLLGLRKKGYKEKIKFLSHKKIIEVFIFGSR